MMPTRKFNSWIPDVPDHRDRVVEAPRVAAAAPPFVDRLGLDNPIEDQGSLGSCTGNSSTSALEITLGVPTPLSRLMAYYNARKVEGTIRQDAGAMIRDVVKGLFKVGVASEATWPYATGKFANKPPKKAYAEASTLKAQLAQGYEYARVPDLATLKAELAKGHPVVFGFAVPESFMTLGEPYLVRFPPDGVRIVGGHAVMAAGYEDREPEPFVWVRNSWGKRWGVEGYFRMTQDWFTDPRRMVDDLWSIRRVGA